MKTAKKSTREDHVKISKYIAEAEDFRKYLALSRDSYPMGLGRLAAICLHVLLAERRHFTLFELDRAVQWPADRQLKFGKVLEMVGWARPTRGANTLEVNMPEMFIPRRPYKETTTFIEALPRDEDGQFLAREEIETRILTHKGRKVLLLTMDGDPRDGVDSLQIQKRTLQKPVTVRKRDVGRTIPCRGRVDHNP